MKITGTTYEQEILKELGNRIKQYRISLNITQIDLANKCGISSSTEVRIENGVDSKISNYIKILIALGLAENLDILIPELQPDFKSLYEQKPQKRRATSNIKKIKPGWVWEEDK
jgi:transcriptional regulator with XRE-family HTH domain